MKEEVHNRVHTMRTKMGITQEELARAVGVSRQTVVAIEKGNYVPSVLLAMKIAGFFNQTVEAIFYIRRT
jgi:putative transcriptional regulator